LIYIDSLEEKAVLLLKNSPISGLTTNPTIIKRDRNAWGFTDTIIYLQNNPGNHFIQGSVKNNNWFKRLEELLEKKEIDSKKFTIKLPWDPLLATFYIKPLKILGFKVCATAVYNLQQAYTALCAGVDYIAFYYDRMKKSNIDIEKKLLDIVNMCSKHKPELRLLGASIKDIQTANELVKLGVHDLTLPLNIAEEYLKVYFPQNDLEIFEDDFKL